MTPPTLESAVEILTEESASIHAAWDAYPFKVQQVAAAIDVVLARLATARRIGAGLTSWRADVEAATLDHGWMIIQRIDELLGPAAASWTPTIGAEVEPQAAPVDFRATMPSYKLGPEWFGATRDDVFGPAIPPSAPPAEPGPQPVSVHGTAIPPAFDMLPCPFCGAADLLILDRHPWTGRDPRCVRCQRCGAFGPAQHTGVGEAADREATANWNRRGGGR